MDKVSVPIYSDRFEVGHQVVDLLQRCYQFFSRRNEFCQIELDMI